MSTVTTPDLRLIEDRLDVLRKLSTPGTNASRSLVDHRIHEACDAVQRALRQCGRSNDAAEPVYHVSDELDGLAAAALARCAEDSMNRIERSHDTCDIDDARLVLGTLEGYQKRRINGFDLQALRQRFRNLLHA